MKGHCPPKLTSYPNLTNFCWLIVTNVRLLPECQNGVQTKKILLTLQAAMFCSLVLETVHLVISMASWVQILVTIAIISVVWLRACSTWQARWLIITSAQCSGGRWQHMKICIYAKTEFSTLWWKIPKIKGEIRCARTSYNVLFACKVRKSDLF